MLPAMLKVLIVAPLLQSGLAFSSYSTRLALGWGRPWLASSRTQIMAAASTQSTTSTSSKDDKEIIFVRHSITYMNEYLGRSLSFGAPGFTDVFSDKERTTKYQDTPLSPNGIRLVERQLARQRPDFCDENVELVVVSPLRRALQTYDLGLRHHLPDTLPVVALPHAAERLYLISDVGSTVPALEKEFPYVDFAEIADRQTPWWWRPQKSAYTEWRPVGRGQRYACAAEPATDFDARMQRLQEWLKGRPEKKIVVVSHHGVIDWLTDMDFDNCQWRSVSLERIISSRRMVGREE